MQDPLPITELTICFSMHPAPGLGSGAASSTRLEPEVYNSGITDSPASDLFHVTSTGKRPGDGGTGKGKEKCGKTIAMSYIHVPVPHKKSLLCAANMD